MRSRNRPCCFVLGAAAYLLLLHTAGAHQATLDEEPNTLDHSWTREVSPSGSIQIGNSSIDFAAPLHGRAHMQRAAGSDLVTFSGKLSNWGSIYLVWGPEQWCGVGEISPTPFARLYSTVVVNGKPEEVDHRGIVNFGNPRWMRIQLGKNYIRFEYSNDGVEWHTLRTVERPKQLARAPQWIAFGKSYEAEDDPFGRSSEKPLPGDRGSAPVSIKARVYEVRLEPTPRDQQQLTESELEALRKPAVDPVMATLSHSDDDPTFDTIARFHPPMKFPREVVGVPAHPLDIGIDYLGRLDVSPWKPAVAWFEVGDAPKPLGSDSSPFKRRLLHGYIPVDTLSATRDGVRYELTFFGWSDEFRVDRPLFAYAQVAMKSSGGPLPKQIYLVSSDGKRRNWTLPASSSGSVHFCIRFQFPNAGSAEEIGSAEFQQKLHDTAQMWEQRLAPVARFDVPDQRVMEAYRAWFAYSMLNADTINGYLEPHDGAGFYEEMFGNSVSMHTIACDEYGLRDYAAEILKTQMHYQQPDGLYTQACGLTDPGAFLVGLVRHYHVTGDRQWLQQVTPHIVKQCEWIIRQRQLAPRSGVERGLIRFRPYNDYVEPVFNYLGNVWCAQGLKDAAGALKELGMTAEADRYAKVAESYRKDILDSMNAAVFVHNGQKFLPLEPDTHRLLKLEKYHGGGYYGLSVSPLLGIGFLTPEDPRTQMFVDALENRGGLIAGVCEFECGIDHAYTYGYLLNELKRGHVRKTLLGFWSMLAFGMTRDTYSPVEVNMIETGENHFTLPHLYSCTEQLRLLRALLLREDGDVLELGEAIPRAWLIPGKHVAVNAAPSEFGPVSYRITVRTDGNAYVHLAPPVRIAPQEIRFHVRDYEHRSISSVSGVPSANITYSGETVVLHSLNKAVDLTVSFGAKS
jgi:hypothetical protein